MLRASCANILLQCQCASVLLSVISRRHVLLKTRPQITINQQKAMNNSELFSVELGIMIAIMLIRETVLT